MSPKICLNKMFIYICQYARVCFALNVGVNVRVSYEGHSDWCVCVCVRYICVNARVYLTLRIRLDVRVSY